MSITPPGYYSAIAAAERDPDKYPGKVYTFDTFATPDKYDGLKQLRPRLAQPWWYRLVGFTYAKPDRPSRGAQAAIRRNERKRAKMRLYCVPRKPDVAA